MRRFYVVVFPLVMAGCAQFLILTFAAMLAYPDGTYQDHTTQGYLFFNNFFSDLGLSQTYSGSTNGCQTLLAATSSFLVKVLTP